MQRLRFDAESIEAERQKMLVYTEDDFDALEAFYAQEARDSFWAYRQFIDPQLIRGWFAYDLSIHLQEFYDDLVALKAPTLVIEAPPQHGKSRGLQDFCSWVAGKDPDLKTMYGSYSDDLGTSANMYLQRVFDDRGKYGLVFPETRINSRNVVTAVAGQGRYLRNSSLLEFIGHKGSFRNVTVNGQVTGKGLDFGLIDDPMKGRNEASSKAIRDKTWNFLLDDFFSRFSEHAGFILTMTRWHKDDPAARWLERFPETKVISYPALWRKAKNKEERRKRSPGDPRTTIDEPLFPEFKSRKFLMKRRRSYTAASFESLYQQSPIIAGGDLFPITRVRVVDHQPLPDEIKRSIRYWDKAGTAGGGAATAGVLLHLLKSGQWIITDVQRGHWGAFDREALIKKWAELDRAQWGSVQTWVEQEPGSGGKESAERTVANLAGFNVYSDRVTGKKEVRAEPYAAQWQGGNILLLRANWNARFIDEHESFPNGAFKDQVDAAAGAFAKTMGKYYHYDSTMKWVD